MQDVEPPKFRDRRLDHCLDRRLVTDVCSDAERSDPIRMECASDRLGTFSVQVRDDDRGAGAAERFAGGAADS